MDNVCHTLVGAALAQTGLKRRTRLGAATLMIGANFPDLDVLAVPFGRAIDFRRGWTHGVLALVVLPFVLTAAMLVWDRWRRRTREAGEPRAVPRELLLLSALAILTHPTLDWTNSYGLRWLMPFDGRWFYGDALFIVDPWLLAVLGAGVSLARRRERGGAAHPWQPARVAVAVATVYVLGMLGLHERAESVARRELAGTGRAARALHVVPSPANPFRWQVIADDGARYWLGAVRPLAAASPRVSLDGAPIEQRADDPAVVVAARTPAGRRFLDWARVPFYRVARGPEGASVTITDLRYGASVDIPVAGPRASAATDR